MQTPLSKFKLFKTLIWEDFLRVGFEVGGRGVKLPPTPV